MRNTCLTHLRRDYRSDIDTVLPQEVLPMTD
jgi:hypothetical protein